MTQVRVPLKFFKVEGVPTEPAEVNSVFYVKGPDDTFTRQYVSDENGLVKPVGPAGPKAWRGKLIPGSPDITVVTTHPVVNSLGELTVQRLFEGQYYFICTGAFPDGSKVFMNLFYSISATPQFFQYGVADADRLLVRTFWSLDGGTYADIDMPISIFIEVYP